METLDNIFSGKAILNHRMDPTTSMVWQILPPQALGTESNIDQESDTDLEVQSFNAERYSGLSAAISARASLPREGVTSKWSMRADSPIRHSKRYTFSTLRDMYVAAASYASMQLADNCVLVDAPHKESQWIGSFLIDSACSADPVSPFERVEELRYLQINVLVDCIGNVYKVSYAKSLKERLTALVHYWKDEHETTEAPSPESLSGLLRFLSSNLRLRMPSIVISPQGTWVAEWRHDANNFFSAHFLDEANARFVAIVELAGASKRKPNQVWGEIEVGKLLDTARAYGADKWVCD